MSVRADNVSALGDKEFAEIERVMGLQLPAIARRIMRSAVGQSLSLRDKQASTATEARTIFAGIEEHCVQLKLHLENLAKSDEMMFWVLGKWTSTGQSGCIRSRSQVEVNALIAQLDRIGSSATEQLKRQSDRRGAKKRRDLICLYAHFAEALYHASANTAPPGAVIRRFAQAVFHHLPTQISPASPEALAKGMTAEMRPPNFGREKVGSLKIRGF